MPSTLTTKPTASSLPAERTDASLVLRALDEFCEGQEPGASIPTYSELMQQFNASDRAVRWALEELQRQGKIVRRRGARIAVADRPTQAPNGFYGDHRSPVVPATVVNDRTIIAISQPDHAFFDHAISLLFGHTEASDLSLVCRMFNPQTAVLPQGERPLGYIVFHQKLLPLAQQLQAAGQRVVLVGALNAGLVANVPNVVGNHERGGYTATRHLLDIGHRSLAFFGDLSLRETPRWTGHQRALAEARKRGLQVEDSFLSQDEYASWRGNHSKALEYFGRSNAPTGIIAWNDHEAAQLLGFLNYIGIRVPDQVSIIGYDALPEGKLTHPALTTVDSAIEEQLQAALDLLTSPHQPSPNYTMMVLPTLIRRDSSAAVAT